MGLTDLMSYLVLHAIDVLLLTSTALIILGLAVMQAGTILLHGSVFEPLRLWIHKKTEADHGTSVRVVKWLKLDDLFMCELCMFTQVSIWLIALPGLVLIQFVWPHPVEIMAGRELTYWLEASVIIFVLVLVVMSSAGSAMLIWHATRLINQLRKKMAATEAGQHASALHEIPNGVLLLTREEFASIIGAINCSCDSAWCGFGRRSCRKREAAAALTQWGTRALEAFHNQGAQLVILHNHLRDVTIPAFFRQRGNGTPDDELMERLYTALHLSEN